VTTENTEPVLQPDPQPVPVANDEAATASIIAELNEMNAAEGITPIESVDVPVVEEGAPAAPPVETPVAPEASTVPIPGQIDQLQQNQQLRVENERLQQGQTQQVVEAEIQRYQAELTTQGVPDDSAKYLADQQRQNLQAMANMQTQTQNALMEQQGKMNAAMHYAQAYGVTPQGLMAFDSPLAMEASAKQQKEINDLKVQVAGDKKAAVPPQVMDTSRSTPNTNTSETRLLDQAIETPAHLRTADQNGAMARAAGY
jgi:hypothetical protein